MLLEDNNQLKETAAYYLYESNSEFAVPYLIQALNSEDYNVVSKSALALGNIGDSRAENALINLVEKYNNELAYSDDRIDDSKTIIRHNVFNSLCLLNTEKTKAKIYESLYDDFSLQIQLRAIRFLYKDQPKDIKQRLIQLTNHTNSEVSTLAQNYLLELYSNMNLQSYYGQKMVWPEKGKHILASFDETSIVVYQAYNHQIGKFAAQNGYFGGEFSYNRMSWIKPNFLWMMYRSGWGTKHNQEVILAVRIKRSFFDYLLEQAVVSNFHHSSFATQHEWKEALKNSDVRLQWDPDHDPAGSKLERKALQLGLRNEMLRIYGREAIVQITNISDFVAQQRSNARKDLSKLITPTEKIYIPSSEKAIENIRLDL